MGRLLRQAWLPCAAAVLLLAPFLGKAFTIDDTVFLFEARHALTDPLHPTAFTMTWTDLPERVSAIVPTGPIMAWLLVPAVAAGGSEVAAHAMQLALVLVAVVATVSLAVRVGLSDRAARLAGFLLVGTPALLGMAGTAMPDVPAMALGVAGIDRMAAWLEERRWHQATAAALLLGLAPAARTHLLILLAVALLLAVEDPRSIAAWRRLRRGDLAILVGAVAVTGLVMTATRDPASEGGGIADAAWRLSSIGFLALNSVSVPVHWTISLPFGIAWAALRRRSLATVASGLAGVVAGAVTLAVVDWGPRYLLAILAAIGAAALTDAAVEAWRSGDRARIALVAWMLLPCAAVVYTHFPSKYLIPAAPAAAILVARLADGAWRGRAISVAVATAGALLGVAILRADATFAEVGRAGVRAIASSPAVQGRALWYDGHWGFQWYAEAAGARCWTAVPPQPRPGDMILTNARRAAPYDEGVYRALIHVYRFEDRRPGGRVMSAAAGAGFYSNYWGLLPWAWGDDLIDAIDLWQAPAAPAGAPGAARGP